MAVSQTRSVILDATGASMRLVMPAYRLRVVKGPDRRKEKRFTSARVLIGVSPGADFVLTDSTVSAVHCEILADSQGFVVRDLGAKNGVRVVGRRVEGAWLSAREELVLGESVVRFELLGDAEETELRRAYFGKLRGSSVPMRELYEQLARAAGSDASVLITGETGTGKELAADAIVSEGQRRAGPLVVVDCARLPAALAESELFGHEKGAFTDAAKTHVGAFERAAGGTIFLDEVGELTAELQPKLLGALERKVVQRVGSSKPIPVDVRVIAATHRELERQVNRGLFRADLFYRLAVIQIRMPPLRERREDIPELVASFLEVLAGEHHLNPKVLSRIFEADYPGNVRELRAALERAVLGFDPDLASAPPVGFDLDTSFRLQKERLIQHFERQYLTRLEDACGGNVSEMARRSGLNRMHVHSLLERLRLKPSRP